jgi:hypothetical protein
MMYVCCMYVHAYLLICRKVLGGSNKAVVVLLTTSVRSGCMVLIELWGAHFRLHLCGIKVSRL